MKLPLSIKGTEGAFDYDDPAVQSRACYEVCQRHGKLVIVMEPVRGGNPVNLPEDAKAVPENLHGGSPVSYALRFAAFPGKLLRSQNEPFDADTRLYK